MDHAAPAPSHHDHAHGHPAHDHAAHDHTAHDHAHPAAPRAASDFSLIALSAPARLLLALPPVIALWLLAAWALGNG